MAGDKTVTTFLKAEASQFFNTMKRATSEMRGFSGTAEKSQSMFKNMFNANILSSAVINGIGAIRNNFVDLIGEMNSSSKAWQTFEGNLKAFGKSSEYISEAKKEMQDYAEQTIYSASDMASTFSQLEAVGKKDTAKLVKAFGGLASSAENPKQAMKSLSVQATQMAAKPKVAWMDFKIMLEQAPSGIAGVAKAMGKTTDELIADVMAGKVKTEEFFDAIKKTAGEADSAFQQMATQYKSADQAMDGLKEGLSNKLQPAFKELDNVAIGVIQGIIDNVGKIDVASLIENVRKFIGVLSKVKDTVISVFNSGMKIVGKFMSGFEKSGAVQSFLAAIDKTGKAIAHLVKSIGNSDVWRQLGEYIGNVVKVISDLAGAMADLISAVPPEVLSALTTGIVVFLTAFITYKSAIGIISKFTGLFSSFGKTAQKTVDGIVGQVSKSQPVIVKVINAIGGNIAKIISALAKGLSTIAQGVATGIAIVMKSLVLVPPTTLLALSVAILAIGGALALIGSQGAGIAEILRGIADAVSILMQGLATSIGTIVQAIAQALPIIAQALVTLTPLVQTIVDGIVLMFNTVVNGIVTLVPVITTAISQIASAIAGIISVITPIIQIIGTTITSIVQVIGSAISSIVSAISSIVSQIAPIINSVANVIRSLGDVITSVLTGAQGIISSFGDVILKVFQGAQGIIESFGNVIRSVLDGLAGIIDSIGNAFEKFGTAIERIGNVALQLPVAAAGILALSVAIAGMGAASWAGNLVGVSNDLATLGTNLSIVSSQTSSFVIGLSMLNGAFSSISTGVTTIGTAFTSMASVMPAVVTAFQSLVPALTQTGTILLGLGVSVGAFVSGLTVINSGVSLFVNGMSQISMVTMMAQVSLQGVSNVAGQTTSALGKIVSVLPQISSGFSNIGSSVSHTMSTFSSAISSAVSQAQSVMSSGMNQMVSIFESSSNRITTMAQTMGQQIASNISKGITAGTSAVNSAMNALVTSIMTTGNAGVSRMQTVGYMIGQGLAVGMRRALSEVTASANALVQQAERAVKAKAQIHSPSRLFRDEVGIFIGQGIAVGIDRSQKDVSGAITGVLESVTRSTADIDDIISGKFSGSVDSTVIHDIFKPNENTQLIDLLNQALNRDIVVEVNGKQLVRAVGKDIDEYQNRNIRSNKILKGAR